MKYAPMNPQPTINASRFRLRPVRRSDAGLIGLYAADERVARSTQAIPHPLPPGMIEAFIARAMAPARTEDVWVMDGIASGLSEVLGVISLIRMDREQSEVGFWVAPAFWNAGIASEAVKALVAANPQSSRTIFAAVFQNNPVSARVLTNADFDYIGDAENYCVARAATLATWTYLRKLD